MDPQLETVIAIARRSLRATEEDMLISVGYTVWTQIKPRIYTFSYNYDAVDQSKGVTEYLEELRALVPPPPSTDCPYLHEHFITNYFRKLDHDSGMGPVRIPFLAFNKNNGSVALREGFELENVPRSTFPKSALDKLTDGLVLLSKFYLGFPGCPVRFNLKEEDFGRTLYDVKCGYPILSIAIAEQHSDLLKEFLLSELGMKRTYKKTSIHKIIHQERIFISPRKLKEWGIPFKVKAMTPQRTNSESSVFAVFGYSGVQMGISCGWNVFQTLSSPPNILNNFTSLKNADPHLKKLVELAGYTVGGHLSITFGYTTWKRVTPGVYTYSIKVDQGDGSPKGIKKYLSELKEDALSACFSWKEFMHKFYHRLESNQRSMKVPFLIFDKKGSAKKITEEYNFELQNATEYALPETSFDGDEMLRAAVSKHYMGFPGCPVRFSCEDGGFTLIEEDDKRILFFDHKFGYPALFITVGPKDAAILKDALLNELWMEDTHSNLTVQQIIYQERIFVAQWKLREWGVFFKAVPLEPGCVVAFDKEGVMMGINTGWNVCRTKTKKV